MTLFEQDEEYTEFTDKFKPKLTTDDCYTPPLVYDAVRDWAVAQYDIDPAKIVRPFYPGGDYINFDYPDGCVVLDNPPFSILAQICEFYLAKNIRFFLFAPALTIFSGRKTAHKINHILVGRQIEYANGAKVNTGFVTNLSDGLVAQAAPELSQALKNAMEQIRRGKTVELPKYEYPAYVMTAAKLNALALRGVPFTVRQADCCVISKLDTQLAHGKAIFGSGLLLSNAAAEAAAAAEAEAKAKAEAEAKAKAAAEAEAEAKAKRIIWELSPRELEVVRQMGGGK